MRTFFPTLGLLLFIRLTTVAQIHWKPTQAEVSFRIRNAGLTVNGTFSGFSGDLIFDPAMPEKAQLSASVDAATIDTGIGLRNNHLKKTDYFDVVNYPRISLRSTRIERQENDAYTGTFELTIKSTTRTVTVPMTIVQKGMTATFAGQFTLDRKDYKVGKSGLLMGDDVTIQIRVQTQQITTPVSKR
ncbi:YceI family protein [Larkinella rosea]|uniref:YceI family protein n=1 Tax=Larkinella rosea TaxID=2025312 RepID=A0A3P1BSB6_9BACT|nr:YceI family protein [Larkinella rosea]RRB03992.1 YceI family protein [Larkinella rosea]